MNDSLKDAFYKVKQDIETLRQEIDTLKRVINDQNKIIQHITTLQQTNNIRTPTDKLTELPKPSPNVLKSSFLPFSTGNEGVPTNQQTNQQTNQRTGNEGVFSHIPTPQDKITHIQRVSKVLESLDDLKKEVRIKFKQLTEQEMRVFATIYQLEEQGHSVDYALLSQTLQLTEISIRDYIRKIMQKGIPLTKVKQGNKKITLQVLADFKRIASLDTILKLREL